MMKFVVVLVFALIAFASADYDTTDGRPGCKTEEEMKVGVYRDNWDPTAYWKCEKLGEPGAAARCADGTAFLDSRKECVLWAEWKWEKPVAPPSLPEDQEDNTVVEPTV